MFTTAAVAGDADAAKCTTACVPGGMHCWPFSTLFSLFLLSPTTFVIFAGPALLLLLLLLLSLCALSTPRCSQLLGRPRYRCAVISSICASFDCIWTVLGDFANKLAVIY